MASRAGRISLWVLLLAALAAAILWVLSLQRIAHDKTVNAELQRLWASDRPVPLGTVVPRDNPWKTSAFVAEKRDGETHIMILDDHYRGDDSSYRSKTGVIGDQVSPGLLCALPAQAAAKGVAIDPAVARVIASRCGSPG